MLFSLQTILWRTSVLLQRGAGTFALATLGLYLLPGLLIRASVGGTSGLTARVQSGILPAYALLVFPALWLVNIIYVAVMTDIALRLAAGRPVTPAAVFGGAIRNAFPLLLLYCLLLLGFLLGSALLVVPGIFFAVAFSVAVPVYVGEGKGILRALKRAFELTKGRRGQIFILWLCVAFVVVVGAVMDIAVVRAGPWVSGPSFTRTAIWFLTALVHDLIYGCIVVLNVCVYLALRDDKKETGGDVRIAAVFE